MSSRPELHQPPSNLFAGAWHPIVGEALRSCEPARPSRVVWSGTPNPAHLDAAVAAARAAQPEWGAWPLEKRAGALRVFRDLATQRADAIASLIRDEVGKPMWDAKAEAGLLAAKVDITLEQSPTTAMNRVTGFELSLSPTRAGRCWFRPHGVMGVLGPFNFPAHLPNGHIVPALAMGNCVVFKPSDKAPAVGQALAELYHDALTQAGAPAGVFNMVQGGPSIAASLAAHPDLDGVLFTGSWPVGRRIMEANLDRPGRLLALEMGGNNPAIILPDADLAQAIIECVRSAFVTTGQRCTCTRRVIIHRDVASRVIPALCKAASSLIIGAPDASHPVFMGPIISRQARDAVLDAQAQMARAGGELLVPCTAIDGPGDEPGWYITPGICKVPGFVRGSHSPLAHPGKDIEVFGPLLRVSIAESLDDAITQANATDFGLAASIFTRDQAAAEAFAARAKAGCINWNTGTAGASSKLPFGGLGLSGNHRPAGAFSLDYCAYPVAGMLERSGASTLAPGMHFDAAWLG
ncbi:MAG: aldehyde dehydrogenase family protein [Phycisphaerales bacterium]